MDLLRHAHGRYRGNGDRGHESGEVPRPMEGIRPGAFPIQDVIRITDKSWRAGQGSCRTCTRSIRSCDAAVTWNTRSMSKNRNVPFSLFSRLSVHGSGVELFTLRVPVDTSFSGFLDAFSPSIITGEFAHAKRLKHSFHHG